LTNLIELDDDMVATLGGGLNPARKDLNDLFLQIFSTARTLSAKRVPRSGPIVISRADWEQAKWRTVHEWSVCPPLQWWKNLGQWGQKLMAFPVGYGFSDPSKLWGWIVVGILAWAPAFVATKR